MAEKIRLSLCMIVRDSSRTLPACLESISPWVDEKIVVDTGSVDETREIATRFGASVFEFPWCDDFSAARNESLRHATGNWLFWMDSDDTITPENGEKLRNLANRPLENAPTAYVMQVHCPGPSGSSDVTVVDHVKLFRNDPRLTFEGRIHEQILPAIRKINGTVDWSDIYVTHSGSDHSIVARRRKQERDLRLLEMERAEKPDHPFVLFNLGMTYADVEDLPQAVDYLKCCLEASSPDESHVRKAYALLVGCLTQMERLDEARRILDRGRDLFPDDAELLFRLGVLEQGARKFEQSIAAYHGALEDRGGRFFSSRDRGITGFKARHNMAGVYREMGRLDLAELQWRLALAEEPSYGDGWRGLVDTLLGQGKLVTLEVEIDAANARGASPDEIACAEARLAARRGSSHTAIQILDAAICAGGDIVEPLRLKCQLLFENSDVEETIAALEQLCRLCPGDGASWHNLGTAYHRAGRAEMAVASYEKSLSLRSGYVPTLTQLHGAQETVKRHEAIQRTRQIDRELVAVGYVPTVPANRVMELIET